MSTIATLWQHWIIQTVAAGITGWAVLSCIINWLLWFKSADEWVAFCEQKPGLAKVVRLIRSMGYEPRKAILWLQKTAEDHTVPNPLPEPPVKDEVKTDPKQE